jgi:uncharacterized membrane protein YeaQ/YmgE (transglycosylase-associated protein family)
MSVKKLSGNRAAGHAFPVPDRKKNDMRGIGSLGATIIGGIAGWIAEKVIGGDHGILTSILLRIRGAVVLNAMVARVSRGTLSGWIGRLIIGAIGATLLIRVWRAVRGHA